MASAKRVGSYTKSGSQTSVPKAKPQATRVPPKAANAVPTGRF